MLMVPGTDDHVASHRLTSQQILIFDSYRPHIVSQDSGRLTKPEPTGTCHRGSKSDTLHMTMNDSLKLLASLLIAALLFVAGCSTVGGGYEEAEPEVVWEASQAVVEQMAVVPAAEDAASTDEPEVPLGVAESEPAEELPPGQLQEVIVEGRRPERYELIRDRVTEARTLLQAVKLEYVFTGKGRRETLRGRPVVFALWSELAQDWVMAHVEIPRPPVRWRPGGKPLSVVVRTPGITATHVNGTGAERLMFAFTRNGEQLKVYGRKFPVFDNALLKKKKWRAVVATAKPIVYLPFTEDTLDPKFISGGKDYLLGTAHKAIEELRRANAPSRAYPGELLADVVPAEVLTTLAVIEQMDDVNYIKSGMEAVNEVLNHYGLKRDEAYRYSVSSAAALGPMQFTNKRGNGTYALTVRRCPAAGIDPNFERGATNLLNAMKAAICLFDIELGQMRADIRAAYFDNKQVLGIFPVAAYNGGPRNVTKLHNVMKRMRVDIETLRRPVEQTASSLSCPCLWTETASGVMPVSIPRYNNENRWYVEKYQRILSVFE